MHKPPDRVPSRGGAHVIRKCGMLLLLGWTGIVFVIALAVACGLEIGLAIASNPYGP